MKVEFFRWFFRRLRAMLIGFSKQILYQTNAKVNSSWCFKSTSNFIFAMVFRIVTYAIAVLYNICINLLRTNFFAWTFKRSTKERWSITWNGAVKCFVSVSWCELILIRHLKIFCMMCNTLLLNKHNSFSAKYHCCFWCQIFFSGGYSYAIKCFIYI